MIAAGCRGHGRQPPMTKADRAPPMGEVAGGGRVFEHLLRHEPELATGSGTAGTSSARDGPHDAVDRRGRGERGMAHGSSISAIPFAKNCRLVCDGTAPISTSTVVGARMGGTSSSKALRKPNRGDGYVESRLNAMEHGVLSDESVLPFETAEHTSVSERTCTQNLNRLARRKSCSLRIFCVRCGARDESAGQRSRR